MVRGLSQTTRRAACARPYVRCLRERSERRLVRACSDGAITAEREHEREVLGRGAVAVLSLEDEGLGSVYKK